ncbi:MAG: T9SS type A sorting domain-containing protein, partial [Saprospiraceae bacterium]|nr:T9SS type A sorting domain-containing protein [Saprospiraceae bacterium]
ITLDIKSKEGGKVEIQLFNQNNQMVKIISAELNQGENTTIISLENLQNGLYYVVVSDNGFSKNVEQFLISR